MDARVGSASTEVERKFLITELPDGLDRCESSAIRQGYLAVDEDGTEVRVRERGDDLTLTVKRGAGQIRDEEEVELDHDSFARLWTLTEGRRVEKCRYLVPTDGDLTIEVDVYAGSLAPLVVAEVEFASEADARRFEPPGWFGRELTGESRFSNRRLALEGLPQDADT